MTGSWREQRPGETSGQFKLHGPGEIADATLALAQQAGMELLIRAQVLDHRIYDRPGLVEAVKQVAIRHPRTRIRILVQDIEQIRTRGHGLVRLAQHLTSSISIRVGASDWKSDSRSFLVADGKGYVLRPRWFDMQDCMLDFNSPLEARKLRDFHTEVWEQSLSDLNLLQLTL